MYTVIHGIKPLTFQVSPEFGGECLVLLSILFNLLFTLPSCLSPLVSLICPGFRLHFFFSLCPVRRISFFSFLPKSCVRLSSLFSFLFKSCVSMLANQNEILVTPSSCLHLPYFLLLG